MIRQNFDINVSYLRLLLVFRSVTNNSVLFFMYLRTYGTLRYGSLRIDTYGSTVRYGFLRYVRVESRHNGHDPVKRDTYKKTCTMDIYFVSSITCGLRVTTWWFQVTHYTCILQIGLLQTRLHTHA